MNPVDFDTLSINDEQLRIVVVDALNYLSTFIPVDEPSFKNATAPALFREMERRVDEFRDASDAAELGVIWVFDNGQASEEAKEKWLERRFKEVIEAERNMPCSAETAFYATLEDAGFLVLYPPNVDGDDAVALLAWELGVKVLSRDRDMLRYEPELPHNSVYKGFGIDSKGRLVLERQTAPLPVGTDRRDLTVIKSEARLPDNIDDDIFGLRSVWGMNVPSLCIRAREGSSKRGNADALTAKYGNVNQHALGLIASVYGSLDGVPDLGVSVSLPAAVHYDTGVVTGAEMVTTVVMPDTCVAKRLVASDPTLAKQWLTETVQWPDDDVSTNPRAAKDHAGRAHAVCMTAAEIADSMLYARGTPSPTSSARRIYEFYKDLSSWAPAPPSATDTDVDDDDEAWCPVLKCTGLSWHGRRSCKAVGGSGMCFAQSIQRARRIGKTPLCSECVTHIATQIKARR